MWRCFSWLLAVSTLMLPAHAKTVIAHRGASAYAPEHTLAAYRLALEQGADFVEQDLAVTKDGVLICLHDDSLERTTNVEEVFPDRFIETSERGRTLRRWFTHDFTLADIKRLDAGTWFGPKFAGERVPTWQEAIDLVKGRAGLYPELKSPELYRARGIRMEPLVATTLRRNGLDRRGANPRTPVILQSFDEPSLRELGRELPELPRILLVGTEGAARLTREGLREVARFADGIGPAKGLLLTQPEIVRMAHEAGLTVTPYTFSSRQASTFASVKDEMTHFLFTLGVDAVFTDNPDLFPRAARQPGK